MTALANRISPKFACLLLIPVLTGCSEHRISMQEFLAMQDQQQAQRAAEDQPAPATQPATDLLRQQIGRYRLGPGDTLAISHYGTEPTSVVGGPGMQVRVDRDGNIELPIVGKLKVAGMDLVQADEAVRSALVPNVFRDVTVHVSLVEPEATRVLVYGAVQEPGLVLLRRTERNMLFAIVSAGGVNQLASGRVTLRRLNDAEQITLNLLDPRELQTALELPPLRDGDLVSVEAAVPNTIFVGGLVLAPRPQPYPPGTQVSILQAIAASGGLRTDVTPTEGTLIRRYPDGREVQVKLDLERIQTGRDPNILLAAGDVLWVPDTVLTRVQDWINRNMFIRVGASATYGLDYSMPGIDYLNSAARQEGLGATGPTEGTIDPFGFLLRNQSLGNIQQRLP